MKLIPTCATYLPTIPGRATKHIRHDKCCFIRPLHVFRIEGGGGGGRRANKGHRCFILFFFSLFSRQNIRDPRTTVKAWLLGFWFLVWFRSGSGLVPVWSVSFLFFFLALGFVLGLAWVGGDRSGLLSVLSWSVRSVGLATAAAAAAAATTNWAGYLGLWGKGGRWLFFPLFPRPPILPPQANERAFPLPPILVLPRSSESSLFPLCSPSKFGLGLRCAVCLLRLAPCPPVVYRRPSCQLVFGGVNGMRWDGMCQHSRGGQNARSRLSRSQKVSGATQVWRGKGIEHVDFTQVERAPSGWICTRARKVL